MRRIQLRNDLVCCFNIFQKSVQILYTCFIFSFRKYEICNLPNPIYGVLLYEIEIKKSKFNRNFVSPSTYKIFSLLNFNGKIKR